MTTPTDDEIRFNSACEFMAEPASSENLQNAVLAFTEIIEGTSIENRSPAYWQRGMCQQRMGLNAGSFAEVITLYKSAQRDFRESVSLGRNLFARQIQLSRWFPEHPCFVPAYVSFLTSASSDLDSELTLNAAGALGQMGKDAAEAIAALETAASRTTLFKQEIREAISQILAPQLRRKSDEATVRLACVEASEASNKKGHPLVQHSTSHEDDNICDVVKAATILCSARRDNPHRRKAFATIANAVQLQPIGEPTNQPRKRRGAALKALSEVPMNEKLRRTLLLERLYFDEFALLRCNAARALIAIDKDLATKAGGYLVLDCIGS